METETELKSKDGTTGTEFAYMIGNEILDEWNLDDIRANMGPRNLKKFEASLRKIEIRFTWKMVRSRFLAGNLEPTRINVEYFDAATGEKITR